MVAAWLNFWVMARCNPGAARLLAVYQGRLRSNLLHDLRPLVGGRAEAVAERLGGLIDGLYLRQGLRSVGPNGAEATAHLLAALDGELTALQERTAPDVR